MFGCEQPKWLFLLFGATQPKWLLIGWPPFDKEILTVAPHMS